jgi:uncharacterized protein YqgV (UPF0045/DUF77 family)
MKTIGRRLFARATVGVPLALKGTINVPNTASMYPPPTSGMGSVGGVAATAAETAKYALRERVYQRLRIDMRPDEEAANVRYTRRNALGGLDPDLSVLNSMSVVRRIQIQIDRDKEANEKARSVRSRIIRMLGGNPEDFE